MGFGQNGLYFLSHFGRLSYANGLQSETLINKDMFQVSCPNIENFSRNSYFQVGGLHVRVRVRVLIIVCAQLRYPMYNGVFLHGA